MTYFHEEQRFGWWLWLVLALIAVPVFVASFALAGLDPNAISAILFGPLVVVLVGGLFALAKLETVVDERGIHVTFHLLWPTRHIALDDVKRAHAMAYNPLLYGGWGVHYLLLRGWSFDAGGGHGVLVETQRGARVMIGSHRAAELEAAIARATSERAAR
jgi:hypothetical protein